jgi:Ras homolog gene family, member A
MGAMYLECSSKEMSGVDEIFEQAINIVVANDESNRQQSSSSPAGQGAPFSGIRKKKRNCRFL